MKVCIYIRISVFLKEYVCFHRKQLKLRPSRTEASPVGNDDECLSRLRELPPDAVQSLRKIPLPSSVKVRYVKLS